MGDFLGTMKKIGEYGSGIGAAAGGIGSALSSVLEVGGLFRSIGSLFGSRSAERRAMDKQKEIMDYSTSLQKQLMELQNQYATDSWNAANEYNSPTQQVARLLDAGLNPNLVYGGNSSVAGNAEAQSAPTGASIGGSTNSQVMSGLMSRQTDLAMIKQMQDQTLVDSQIDLNHANADAARSNAGLNVAQSHTESAKYAAYMAQKKKDEAQALFTEFENAIRRKAEPELIAELKEQLRETRAQAAYYEQQAAGQEISNRFSNETFPLRLQITQQNLEQAKHDVINAIKMGRKIDSDTALNYERVRTEKTQQKLNLSNAALAEVEKVSKQIANEIASLDLEFNKQTFNVRISMLHASLLDTLEEISLKRKQGEKLDSETAKNIWVQKMREYGIDVENKGQFVSISNGIFTLLTPLFENAIGLFK